MDIEKIHDYAFQYDGAMDDAMQSLPIGNGDIGANVWLSKEGDVHVLVSKTDSWSELYRLLKPAHVVLKMQPNPFVNGAHFDLSIANGTLDVSCGNNLLQVYVDAFAPCIRLSLDTEQPVDTRIEFVNYRSEPIDPKDDFSNYFMRFGVSNIIESADIITVTPNGGVAQIHRNHQSCYEFSLKNQDMEGYIGREKDPLLGRTFGAGVYSSNMLADGDGLSAKKSTKIQASIFVNTTFTECVAEFTDSLDALYGRYGEATLQSFANHVQSWAQFWKKAYIYAEGDEEAELITKAFLYQRYITHCADRGNAPIKFNGSLFTADTMQNFAGNYDARRWGAPYWTQNTRIIYWYLLNMGDYDAMAPMLDMYLNIVPVSRFRCHTYFGHDGILIPETVSYFGLYANPNYGFKDAQGMRYRENGEKVPVGEPCNTFIRYHYNGMLEISYMMLKYLEASGDVVRRDKIFEFVEQSLRFFDCRFEKVNGKMVMTPVSALETVKLCVNDTPNVAGLTAICKKIAETSDVPNSLKKLAESMYPTLPEIPIKDCGEGTVIASCETQISDEAQNVENPELYTVFPYDLYGVGKDGLDTARRTYYKRECRLDGCWSQDPVDAVLLGMEDEAIRHLLRQSKMTDKRALFPAFWGPNFDETPDQDHGDMTSLCFLFMLLQANGKTYKAFPLWPKKWNVRFRLPLRHDTYICGEQINGVQTVREESLLNKENR